MHKIRFINCLACLMLCLAVARSADAQFEPLSISVLPNRPTTVDEVVIRHDMTYSTGGYRIGGSNVSFSSPDEFIIDIFVIGPDPGDPVTQTITFLNVESNLGTLAAGDYRYTSRIATIPRSAFPDPVDEDIFLDYPPGISTGAFTVIPEPTSLSILLIGGLALTRRRHVT